MGDITTRAIKGDTWSFDYSSFEGSWDLVNDTWACDAT